MEGRGWGGEEWREGDGVTREGDGVAKEYFHLFLTSYSVSSKQLKYICVFLSSRHLVLLTDSITHTTEETKSDFKQSTEHLEELQNRCLLMEREKDRATKLSKKRV